jgi:serine/threonine protein kinase
MADPSKRTILGGRYRLDSLLGQGGMGTVHRAVDLKLDRPVAVKVVDAHSRTPDIHARFVREARRTAQIRHPHVVEVFDHGETDSGDLYFVMELLEGEALSARLARDGRLSLGRFLRIAREMCEGLGAAHALGIVHRDVKPANVMLVAKGRVNDYVKIVDFGIAKAQNAGTQLTEAGMFLGTLEYISPEQIMGEALDPRADVYALGVVFHRMLTGRPLYPDVPRSSLVMHHLETVPMRPEVACPEAGIPRSLSDLVMRCLEKSAKARYSDAAEVGAELASFEGLFSISDDGPPSSLIVPAAASQPDFDPLDDSVTVASSSGPHAELVLELADAPRSAGTALMARPVSQTCASCKKYVAETADACPHCGAPRLGSGMRPVARRSAAFAAGPPRVEVPWGLRVLGVLPMWLSLPLAVGASLGLAFLIQQGVPGRLGYAALTLGLVVGIVSVVARRVADRYGT